MSRGHALFVAPSAYLLSGLASWMDTALPGLTRCGWQVTLGLVEGPEFHRPDRYLREHPFPDTVTIPCQTGTTEGRVGALTRVIERVAPDLVVTVNIPDTFAALDRVRGRRGARPRGVMTIHGIEVFPYEDLRRFGPAIDAVICTNRLACRLALGRGGVDGGRLFHAPYGVEIHPRSPRGRERFSRVAWVGRLEQWQKRVMDLPRVSEALSRHGSPVELWVAGDGPEEERLRETIVSAKLPVRLLGRVAPMEMRERVYSDVDALLVTSRWETGPIVIWEAMAAGIPVVSSRYVGSGLEGALEHERNALLFDVGDAQGAAERLQRLARDPELRARLSRAGRELVTSRYSVDASVRAWDTALSAVQRLDPRRFAALEPRSAGGHLDRWFGPGVAERIRRVSRRRVSASDPGGEWPHSYSQVPHDDPAFWDEAEAADGEEPEGTSGAENRAAVP